MAQSIVGILIQQEGDTPAHHEVTVRADQHFFGSDGDTMREFYEAKQRAQAAHAQAAREYQALCQRWQAGLEAYMDHYQRMGANALTVQSAAGRWISVHPFPKPPEILCAKPVSIFNAVYCT